MHEIIGKFSNFRSREMSFVSSQTTLVLKINSRPDLLVLHGQVADCTRWPSVVCSPMFVKCIIENKAVRRVLLQFLAKLPGTVYWCKNANLLIPVIKQFLRSHVSASTKSQKVRVKMSKELFENYILVCTSVRLNVHPNSCVRLLSIYKMEF